jgi:FkbM family methyltransferase
MDIQQVNGVWVPSNDVHLQDWISGKPFTQNKCLNEFLKHCKDNNIKFNTVIDIGAWCGTWSLSVGPLAKNIIAFEPDELHFQCLQKNKLSNMTCYNVALGNKERQVGLSKDLFTQAKHITDTGTIQMQILDSYNFTDADFIKIDVEGYEMEVLKGAANTLQECKYLMIELNNNSKKFGSSNGVIEQHLDQLGWKVLIHLWPDKVFVNTVI